VAIAPHAAWCKQSTIYQVAGVAGGKKCRKAQAAKLNISRVTFCKGVFYGKSGSKQLQPAASTNHRTAKPVPQIRRTNRQGHSRRNAVHFPAVYPLRLQAVRRRSSRHHSGRGVLIMVNIGLSGSRYLVPSCIYPVVSALMLSAGRTGQASFNIGCCPTGLDQVALQLAQANHIPFSFFKAARFTASALRLRTLQLVWHSRFLFSFPSSCQLANSGSWLAVKEAASLNIPVFVHLPSIPPALLPIWSNIAGWQHAPAASLPFQVQGFSFYQPIISTVQTSLFKGV
jgi:hypothetical protein